MTMAARVSLWDNTAEEPDHEAELPPGATADVAIVGGGFTGLSTALHGAERGLDCLVLEAQRIGHGGSGRNVGLVNAGVWHPPAAVRSTLGPTFGPRFIERFGAAPDYVFSLIEHHQIRCEATRNGTIHAAHSASGLKGLEGRHSDWSRLGAPVEMLDRERIAELAGTRRYLGGMLDRRAGTVNPMGYVRGLARAARGAGARIATGVRATGLRRENGGWIVETDRGPVKARFVVLGTNAYTDQLWPGLDRVFTLIPYFQFATVPLGARAEAVLPGRHGMWDTAQIMTSLRKDVHGRLFLGSMGRVMGDARSGLSHRWAARTLARLYPDLGPVEFEEAWHGDIALTPDHLPRIHRLAEGLYTPIGYNGRGITTGTIFGKAMVDLLTGIDPADLPLPMSGVRHVPATGLRARLYRAAFAANQIVKGF
ncbi:FAD-binding oxidoreductase [Roseibacterium sp. SDUM158016]|uniref:NAD(P)/FAD-dependent oxidoreductase n=1 Tax=Roseicyclus sediminis TaxID=2980997 RepID=UPI0021D1D828|nr:FAD-binding oxidoreductase [Roseibacterium sp. SDUM158016]MCU4653714.1 FAD-binding oxidoreductase [Roseibacterium sp. SDUM158016]